MTKDPDQKPSRRGYGNIYTPHAGSMIIHVQRESGLANRTFVLSERQVILLRRGLYVIGALLITILATWFYFAAQAARVPLLTRRIRTLQHDVRRLDTLQAALAELEGRFKQVQQMLGASPPPRSDSSSAPTLSLEWPLTAPGTILAPLDTTSPRHGIDIATPSGTLVRAAQAGLVADITNDPQHGTLVRITHRNDYETIYANVIDVRVNKGDRVSAGTTIARSGNGRRNLPPHLHFELHHAGVDVNPTPLMQPAPTHGNLQ